MYNMYTKHTQTQKMIYCVLRVEYNFSHSYSDQVRPFPCPFFSAYLILSLHSQQVSSGSPDSSRDIAFQAPHVRHLSYPSRLVSNEFIERVWTWGITAIFLNEKTIIVRIGCEHAKLCPLLFQAFEHRQV